MRKLSLRKEALTELGTDELAGVAGAGTQVCVTDPCITPPPPSRIDCTFSLGPAVCG